VTPPVFVSDDAALVSAAPGSVVTVSGPEGRHAVTVRRIRVGERVDVVAGAGRRLTGVVVSISGKDAFDVRADVVTMDASPQPRMTVVQALAKGDRGERAVELLTEIGVDDIVPWSATNCVTQWRTDREDRSWQKWVDTSVTAAKQARRARFPVVHRLASSDRVIELVSAATVALVLHEDAVLPIGSVALPVSGDVVVVVGPEGGLTNEELDLLAGAGARSVRLGPTVLRTSSAGIAAVAALLSRSARWSVPSEVGVALPPSVEG
jgi:16S rRNA (uracil1498-N3)-methyltransferase